MSSTESSLRDQIDAARAGDAAAQDALLSRYRGYLTLLARMSMSRGVQAKFDASDVVQDALVRAHEGFGEFRGLTEAEMVGWSPAAPSSSTPPCPVGIGSVRSSPATSTTVR